MPISFGGQGILLDIEGTTSSVQFVYEVLFPYVRAHLDEFIEKSWKREGAICARELIAKDAGAESFPKWCGHLLMAERQKKLAAEVIRLMDADSKSTGLKALQGLISKEGYASGALRAHVYPDVPEAFKRWKDAGKAVRIFSSGSITAQQELFEHTEAGNLRPFLSGHYDTTTGPKREAESYRKIAAAWELAPREILFVSDVPAELDAACAAGMQTALSVRPGNAALPEGVTHPRIASFDEIELT
ncbi:MAG: acireductone synthase [Planctomycetota bacterium]|nr:acireductone synthase [Planctomycetota bacterium]